MQHSSGPEWYARELAQLQEEITRLHKLLEVIAPGEEPHGGTSGLRDGAISRLASATHGGTHRRRRPMLRVRKRMA